MNGLAGLSLSRDECAPRSGSAEPSSEVAVLKYPHVLSATRPDPRWSNVVVVGTGMLKGNSTSAVHLSDIVTSVLHGVVGLAAVLAWSVCREREGQVGMEDSDLTQLAGPCLSHLRDGRSFIPPAGHASRGCAGQAGPCDLLG